LPALGKLSRFVYVKKLSTKEHASLLKADTNPCQFSKQNKEDIISNVMSLNIIAIDINSLQNRLLNVCYVPATSAGLNRLLFFFFAAVINSINEANKAGGSHH
jgi:hypothetical protein